MAATELFTVEWQPLGRRTPARAGENLLEAARAAGVELTAVCGGEGTCGRCRIRLADGSATPPTPEEERLLGATELKRGMRLACLCRPRSDLRIDLPPESLAAPQRLQLESLATDTEPDPVAPADPPYGLAFDIGTTKLAAYLLDLRSGRVLAQAGAPNPHIVFGEDVISRIAYSTAHPDGLHRLRSGLTTALDRLTADLSGRAGLETRQIGRVVAVGNTVMHHILAGLPVKPLGESPYAPATLEPLELPAEQIGLTCAPEARVYLPPVIAGFVGSDHVAVQLACLLHTAPRRVLALDIGTNTEITLADGEHLVCCSCASGPVFEGARIRDGMRAAPGAIESVQIAQGAVRVETIGRAPAIGICGSGILDAVAEMLRTGALDPAGRPKAGWQNGEFQLVPPQPGTGARGVGVTRADVRQVQLAKAAIRTGIEMVLRHAGIRAADLQDVLVAGAFGTYLNVDSARRTGMFPDLPRERFQPVGNAAGAGARQMLLSAEKRRAAERLAQRTICLDLAREPGFTELYSEAMLFP